jgi:hypothetical protein
MVEQVPHLLGHLPQLREWGPMKQIQIQRPKRSSEQPEIDTRTPSGRPLPY